VPPADIRGSRLISPEDQSRRVARRPGSYPPPRQFGPRRPTRRRRRSRVWLPSLFAAVSLVAIAGILYLLLNDRDQGGLADSPDGSVLAPPDDGETAAGDQGGDALVEGDEGDDGGQSAEDADGDNEPSPDVVASPPFVRASLVGKTLTLSGVVPSEELAARLEQAAQLAYAPFVQSEVQVDTSLAAPDWLNATPEAVILLQTITEGLMTISDGRIDVTGKAGSELDISQLQEYVTAATGLSVDVGGIELTNRRETVYLIAGDGDQVALSGALPTDEIHQGLYEAAVAAYGVDNVLDASMVDETVNPSLWMYNPNGLMAALSAFPVYEVRIDGRAFSASLRGGPTFEIGSADIQPAFAQVLNFGALTMVRDPAMTLLVEGHTDSNGPDDLNLELSQQRADAVVAYLQAAGIDPGRITAVGKGETDPIAPNDTPENRALNRRVEFVLSAAG